MESTRAPNAESMTSSSGDIPRVRRRKISVLGVVLRLVVAVGILAGAVVFSLSLIASRPEMPQRQPRERSFTVEVVKPEFGAFSPTVNSFGQIIAARSIDVRAQVSGEAVEVSPNLEVGGSVEKGELLVRIDSFSYDGAVRDAEAALADARLQLTAAQEQLEIEKVNRDAAESELELARRDLERAQSLSDSGTITNKTLEDRALLVAQREQAIAQRESAIRVQQATIERQTTAISRAEWARDQASRSLSNTEILAPFDGVVTSQSAAQGRIISSGEVVAQMYDRDALEARFTLSDQQYGLLVNAGLIGRPVTAIWDIDPQPLIVKGSIVRAGAEVDAALGGVEVYARLDGDTDIALRPGTFVSIEVEGLAYENALRLPETAVYENDHLYIKGAENRMERIDIELLARDGQDVIVRGDMAHDADVITTRVSQAGEGVLVKIEGGEDAPRGQRGGNRSATEAPADKKEGAEKEEAQSANQSEGNR